MKRQQEVVSPRRGLVATMVLIDPNSDTESPLEQDGRDRGAAPAEHQQSDEENLPDAGERVENLPPEQPDVDPLKRENPDLQEIDENRPDERPEIDRRDVPNPETDHEADPDVERREIDPDPARPRDNRSDRDSIEGSRTDTLGPSALFI